MPDIWFVYDGACPLCQIGASYYRLRQSVGALHTVDARRETEHPVMQEIHAAGIDVDQGMVLKYQGQLYHGAKALQVMATLGADTDFFNRLMARVFCSPRVSRASYPFMKLGRNLALACKGVGRIGNLARY